MLWMAVAWGVDNDCLKQQPLARHLSMRSSCLVVCSDGNSFRKDRGLRLMLRSILELTNGSSKHHKGHKVIKLKCRSSKLFLKIPDYLIRIPSHAGV